MGDSTMATVAARRASAGQECSVADRPTALEAACCGAAEQATCCAPEAKASCCGTPAAEGNAPSGGCGCR